MRHETPSLFLYKHKKPVASISSYTEEWYEATGQNEERPNIETKFSGSTSWRPHTYTMNLPNSDIYKVYGTCSVIQHTHAVSVIDHHVWEVLIKYMAPPISSWAQNRATELYDMTGWRLRAVSISNEVTPQFQHSFDHFSVSWFQI